MLAIPVSASSERDPSQPLRSGRFLRRIHDIAVASYTGFHDEIDQLLKLGCDEFGFESGAVTSLEAGKLEVLYSRGTDRIEKGSIFAPADTFCAEVIRTGQPLVIGDAAVGQWSSHPGFTKLGIRAYLGTPILFKGGLAGSVCFLDWRVQPKSLHEDDLELLQLLAQRIESVLERLEFADALRQSEALFRATFEHANVGIAHVGIDGNWLKVNPRLCEIMGYTADELRSMTFQELTHPNDLESTLDWYRQALDGEIDSYSMQKRYVRKDGYTVWAQLTVKLLRDDKGTPPYFISVIEDITEQKSAERARKRFEERVQETQKLESLGVLAGGIAHDFNNLLTAIMGNVSFARESIDPQSSLYDQLTRIENAASHAADLTDQLLAYAGKGAFVVQALDVGEIIDGMQNLLHTAVSKKAQIGWQRRQQPTPVQADATQLRQVLMNLMTNASEALEDRSGVISISVAPVTIEHGDEFDASWTIEPRPGSYFALRVADDGCGMTAETRRRLFEPFFSQKFIGRGLGLSAVLGIVRGHNGALRVQSVLGEGTTMTVLFPAAEAVSAAATDQNETMDASSQSALVVDDEENVRDVAARMIEHLGIRTTTASNGAEAMQLVAAAPHDYSLILLDVTMPGVAIEETIAGLRAANPGIPVVLMSGYNEEEVTALMTAYGLSGFLKKPFTLAAVKERVSTALATD